MDELHVLEWNHPRLGRIQEVACRAHEREVLLALKILGIGCLGTAAPNGACHRCAHPNLRVATWIAEAVKTDA